MNHSKLITCTVFLLFFALNKLSATTWAVGAIKTYTALSQVKPLVQNNDTILIDAGIYLNDPVKWDKKNLHFKGLGTGTNRTIMRWNAGDIANGKGIWVFELVGLSDNPSIDNIVFDGARVSDNDGANGAGIRFQAKDITITNCVFMNCQNGILEGNGSVTDSNVKIMNTEFTNNGYETTGNPSFSGYEHHMYISASADTFWLQGCYIHNPRGEANSVKTRAQRSFILYNLISEENGAGSWEINIAQGGLSIIMGNTIVQGINSVNHGMVSYDAATNAIEDFYFINNTVINKYAGNIRYFNISPTSGINVFKVYNNSFASNSSASNTWLVGSVASLDSMHNRQALNYTSVGFSNPTTDNYQLTSSATSLINNGISAGVASNGFSLTPTSYYNTLSTSPRINNGLVDIGAFEQLSSVGVPTIDSPLALFTLYKADLLYVNILHEETVKAISITDISGKKLLEHSFPQTNSIAFNVNTLSAGIYIITLTTESGLTYSRKFIND